MGGKIELVEASVPLSINSVVDPEMNSLGVYLKVLIQEILVNP